MRILSLGLLVSKLVMAQTPALPASEPPAKPRVFVILDSSTSMKETPDYTTSSTWVDLNVIQHDDTTLDPLNNPVNDLVCRSKFCIAKKTVHNVLQSYVERDVRVGMGTYFQYLLKATSPDTSNTRCWYDAAWKAGATLYYPPSGAYAFNDDTRLASVSNVQLSGASIAGTRSNQFFCASGAQTQYNLTEEAWPNPAPSTCIVYNQTANPGASLTLTSTTPTQTGCAVKPYSVTGFVTEAPVYKYRRAAGLACPAAVPQTGSYAAAPAASTISVTTGANNTTCSGNNTNCWVSGFAPFGSPVSNSCSTTYPCRMYSGSTGTEVDTTQPVTWAGLFGGTCTGGSQPAGPNGTDSNSSTGVCPRPDTPDSGIGVDFYRSSRTGTAVTSTAAWTATGNTNNCNGLTVGVETRRTTGGVNGNVNTDYSTVTLVRNATGLGTLTFPSGTNASTNACTANWPCDVTLTARVPQPTPNTVTVNTCTASVGPPSVTCAPTTAVTRRLLKLTTCGALGTATTNPAGTWESSPACGAGNAQCRFTTGVPSESAGGNMPGCSAVTKWDGTVPGSCTYGGQTSQMIAGVSTTHSAYIDLNPSSSCTATTATALYTGTTPAAATALSSCVASGACRITNGMASLAPTETTSTTTSLAPPDATWSSQTDALLGDVFVGSGPCTAVNGSIAVVSGQLLQFSAGPGPGATTANGTVGDGTPKYECRYQAVRRTWSRNKTRCTYNFTGVPYTPPQITWCNYSLARDNQTTTNTTYSCSYTVKARTFSFARPLYRECNYFRTQTTLKRNLNLFRYSYQAKGGELVGSHYTELAGNKCDPSVAYSSFSSTCPTTIDGCKGNQTQCLLRTSTDAAPQYAPSNDWLLTKPATGRFASLSVAGANSGAYVGEKRFASNATATTNHMGVEDGVSGGGGRACILSDFWTPPATETRAAYCAMGGAESVDSYKLVNDYVQCSDPNNSATCAPNDITALLSDVRTDPAKSLKPGVASGIQSGSTLAWTNTATKAQGLSAVGSPRNQPGPVLMTFPPDNDTTGGISTFRSLLSTCERPSTSNVTWPNWNTRGICMPDTGAPATATNGDFTPLYGSLVSVKQYLQSEVATDDSFRCRPYFVLLATDGKENTPMNATQSNLNDAVTALRGLTTSNGRRVDVKTFVLGMGDGASDPTTAASLNEMADRGGTNNAYFASDGSSLQTKLSEVFASILRGSYSRTKPTLSSDGKSLYASFFARSTGTPEWKGYFTAYSIQTDGSLTVKWEHGTPTPEGAGAGFPSKLNIAVDSTRKLYTDVFGVRQAFTTANASAFANHLNTSSTYPGGAGTSSMLPPSRIVSFVRNASLEEPFFVTAGAAPVRTSRLNAVVASAPVSLDRLYRPAIWGGTGVSGTSYVQYQAAQAARETRVLVGGSDGLLRAIRDNASVALNPTCATNSGGAACPNGNEAWAWVPSPIHSQLYKSMLGYTPGVDGQIATEDVCRSSSGSATGCTQSDWKTIAIASVGGGGRGLVALDVTDPDDPRHLWTLKKEANEDQLGYATAPVVGRIQSGSDEKFVAIIGGGRRHNGTYGTLNNNNGDEVYVLDAVTGQELGFFNDNGTNGLAKDDIFNEDNQFTSRPSFFRRATSPFIDTAFLSGTAGVLYGMRFRAPVNVQTNGTIQSTARTTATQWEPKIFFDPTASGAATRSPTGAVVRVRRVVSSVSGTVTTYTMEDCSTLADGTATCGALPLPDQRRLPFHQRPKIATVYDSNALTPDIYMVTGDALAPDQPGSSYYWNYVYALHDVGLDSGGASDGRPLWVNQLLTRNEQIVAEPTLVSGNLLVASYTPPGAGSGCTDPGSTTFYCFDPKTGDLKNCFPQSDGTSTSVTTFPNVGIPSDPLVVNGQIYWVSSNPPPGQVRPNVTSVVPSTTGGTIRSYRKVK